MQTTTVVLPSGRVKVYGVEFQAELKATRALTLEATYAYAETDIRSSRDVASQQLLGDPNQVGHRLPRYPAHSGSASATFQEELRPRWEGFVRADYIYTGRQYDSEAHLAWTAPAHPANLRLGVNARAYRVEVFANNLFNNRTPINIARATDTYTGVNALSISPRFRRVTGVKVSLRR